MGSSTSTETAACSSSESIDYGIVRMEPAYEDVEVLLGQNHYIDSFPDFLSGLRGTHVIDSGGLILGLFSVARYGDVRASMCKRLTDAADRILDGVEGGGDAFLFFNTRIGNVPLDMVFELYRKIELVDGCYVFVSQVDPQDKRSVEAAAQTFREFSKRDLRLWPRKSEEVFLLGCSRRAFVECRGARYNVYVLRRDEFECFLAAFGDEMAK